MHTLPLVLLANIHLNSFATLIDVDNDTIDSEHFRFAITTTINRKMQLIRHTQLWQWWQLDRFVRKKNTQKTVTFIVCYCVKRYPGSICPTLSDRCIHKWINIQLGPVVNKFPLLSFFAVSRAHEYTAYINKTCTRGTDNWNLQLMVLAFFGQVPKRVCRMASTGSNVHFIPLDYYDYVCCAMHQWANCEHDILCAAQKLETRRHVNAHRWWKYFTNVFFFPTIAIAHCCTARAQWCFENFRWQFIQSTHITVIDDNETSRWVAIFVRRSSFITLIQLKIYSCKQWLKRNPSPLFSLIEMKSILNGIEYWFLRNLEINLVFDYI